MHNKEKEVSLIYNFDYRTSEQGVEVVSLKGYPTSEAAQNAPAAPEGVARVVLQTEGDVQSLGELVLRSLWNYKAKKPVADTDPVDAALTWELLQPKPRKQKEVTKKEEKDLTPPSDPSISPSNAANSGGQTKEKKMASKKKAATKKKAAKAKTARKSTGPRGEKTLAVKALLQRAKGCTRADILTATGWPAVSVQAMAKACGLKLRKEKEKGKPTTYFGS